MHTPPFPPTIDPFRLTTEGARLAGTLPLSTFPRLAPLLASTQGTVAITLVADTDAQGFRRICCALRTEVALICQRCLSDMPFSIDIAVTLAVVRSDAEAERLPDAYEPLCVLSHTIFLPDVIEDELLLALPQIPRHEDERACTLVGVADTTVRNLTSASASDTTGPTQRPFAGLAARLQEATRQPPHLPQHSPKKR